MKIFDSHTLIFLSDSLLGARGMLIIRLIIRCRLMIRPFIFKYKITMVIIIIIIISIVVISGRNGH